MKIIKIIYILFNMKNYSFHRWFHPKQSKKGSRKGGIGIFFEDKDPRNLSLPLVEQKNFKVTNNVAELTATVTAIETILEV